MVKMTKEEREEMKAHAMVSKLAGFKRVQMLIEHAFEILDTIDKLEDELELLQINREKVLAALRGGCTAEQLKQVVNIEPLDEVLLLPGSDVGQGRLNLAHWHIKILAGSMLDLIHLNNAQNYVELNLSDGEESVIVTVQREGGESPAKKAERLEQELKKMTVDRDRLLQAVIDCARATTIEDSAWCKEDVESITNEALTDRKENQ